jgi:hypothetical protein
MSSQTRVDDASAPKVLPVYEVARLQFIYTTADIISNPKPLA